MSTIFEQPIYDTTHLDTRLVALLTGASVESLDEWHRQGIAPASREGLPGDPPGYSWRDYHRARVVAGLAERGVEPECLGGVIEALECGIDCRPEENKRSPLELEKIEGAIVFYDDDPLPTYKEVVFASRVHGRRVGCAKPKLVGKVLREIDESGTLGKMSIFREWLDISRAVMSSWPILKGHRIRTEMVLAYGDGEAGAAACADALEVDIRKVRAAQIFERELARIPRRDPLKA